MLDKSSQGLPFASDATGNAASSAWSLVTDGAGTPSASSEFYLRLRSAHAESGSVDELSRRDSVRLGKSAVHRERARRNLTSTWLTLNSSFGETLAYGASKTLN